MEQMECECLQHEQYGMVEQGEHKHVEEEPSERYGAQHRRHVILELVSLQGDPQEQDTPPRQGYACGGVDAKGIVKRIDGDSREKSEAVQQEIRDAYGKQQDDQHIGEGGGQVIVAHVLE